MDTVNLVTKFINSGEIQEMAKQQPEKEDIFTTGAIWASCRLAELAHANPTVELKHDCKHNIFYCGNCNRVIYGGKSSSRSLVQTRYKYCYNCGRRFKNEEEQK